MGFIPSSYWSLELSQVVRRVSFAGYRCVDVNVWVSVGVRLGDGAYEFNQSYAQKHGSLPVAIPQKKKAFPPQQPVDSQRRENPEPHPSVSFNVTSLKVRLTKHNPIFVLCLRGLLGP
jgi:hypothetical protein